MESIFPEKKGEWEIIYHAKAKEAGHLQPKVPLWGYNDEADPKWDDKLYLLPISLQEIRSSINSLVQNPGY